MAFGLVLKAFAGQVELLHFQHHLLPSKYLFFSKIYHVVSWVLDKSSVFKFYDVFLFKALHVLFGLRGEKYCFRFPLPRLFTVESIQPKHSVTLTA